MTRTASTLLWRLAFILTLLLCAGCTQQQILTLARYVPGGQARRCGAPYTGEYAVRFDVTPGEYKDLLVGTRRIVQRGDPIGFYTDEQGCPVALAADESISLQRLPRRAKSCVWYYRTKQPTEFGRAMAALGEFFAQAGALAGQAAFVASIGAAEAYVEGELDRLDEDWHDLGHRAPDQDHDRDHDKPRGPPSR